MKKLTVGIFLFFLIMTLGLINSCKSTSAIVDSKSGAQLWGENCIRCHNAPSPISFSDAEWDVAVMHMRVRANLTEPEATKIAIFLKTAN